MPEDKLLLEMTNFQKDVVFWGSDRVIKEYLDFKDHLTAFSAGGDATSDDELAVALSAVFVGTSQLLSAMRRDIGYSFTSFSAQDLARMQLNADPTNKKLLEILGYQKG